MLAKKIQQIFEVFFIILEDGYVFFVVEFGFQTWLGFLHNLKLLKLDFKKYKNLYSVYMDYILKIPALQRNLLQGTNLYPA